MGAYLIAAHGLCVIGLLLLCAVAADDAAAAESDILLSDGQHSCVRFWLESSLRRVYPKTPAGNRTALDIYVPRNGKASFQVCVMNASLRGLTVRCGLTAPDRFTTQVRRVGYVPMHSLTAGVPLEELDGLNHTPGLVPDVLYEDQHITASPQSTHAFWVSIRTSAETAPGTYPVIVQGRVDGAEAHVEMTVTVHVSHLRVDDRRDFPVTHWWNADGIYDYYMCPPFGDDWFRMAERYLRNMRDHGSDVIFVPLFHHRMEVVPRPAQLLVVTEPRAGRYRFDWSRVRRFVAMARRCGFTRFEWPHLWHMKITPQGVITAADEPQRVYLSGRRGLRLVVPRDASPTDPRYLRFLDQLLPDMHAFLQQENLLDSSLYHVSDEPGGNDADIARYKTVRDVMVQKAPWMAGRILDAMSDVRYGRSDLMDFPVPNVAAAADYMAEGIQHWVYYCCGPKGPYLNRFMDTPLPKIRMSGLLFYKLRALGFLHWGFNYWYVMDLGHNPEPQKLIDPFTDGAVGTSAGGEGEPYGDSFVVYPGPNGPLDSIRWEVFAEALQDYALLQSAGIRPDDPMLAPLIDYANFPKDESWITETIRTILTQRH